MKASTLVLSGLFFASLGPQSWAQSTNADAGTTVTGDGTQGTTPPWTAQGSPNQPVNGTGAPVTSSTTSDSTNGTTASAVLSPERLRRRAFVDARLSILNRALVGGLSGQSRGVRLRSGITSLVLGTGLIVAGFFVPSSPLNDMRPWFWGSGAAAVAMGGLETLWTPQTELLPDRYQAMPMMSPRDRSRRVRFGEESLRSMAGDASRRRIVMGLTKIASSLAMLLVMYREPIFNGRSYTFSAYDAVVIGYSGVDFVLAGIDLFTTSPEQRLLTQYEQTIQLIRQEQEAGIRSAYPIPGSPATQQP